MTSTTNTSDVASENELGYATIKKDTKASTSANMTNYETMCDAFSWDAMAQELGIDNASHINKASICIDNHPEAVMKKTALIWKGADGSEKRFSFNELKEDTNRFANVLSNLGIKKGDRVFIYLERIPEIYITLFGALKCGGVVGPLFSAFGPEAIKDRLEDSGARYVITSTTLKPRLDEIKKELPALEHVIVIDKNGNTIEGLSKNESAYHPAMQDASSDFNVVDTTPDDYSIIHYTSGTTGKPKGAVHRHNAITAQYATSKYILDLKPNDIYWCTADPGWVTGTSYGMFGPWSLGVTQLMVEGGFKAEDWYQTLQDYKVSIWYTAPTAIRMLMKAGDEVIKNYDLSALRHLCSVGEPLNPEAVVWAKNVYGKVFHDTWWQTKTGSMHICNYPCMDVKPGSMGRPFPGITAGIIDEDGNPLPDGQEACPSGSGLPSSSIMPAVMRGNGRPIEPGLTSIHG